ncbi:precorrin-6Y C5,15-methyltransferase (decarboxylating) [Tenacibaculum sp. MAR_2009_124]|uniref:precorrin-6y C5,15-methyltransferase (decarboxylating) subunit CbiE n=1 Tax=Tenacibaculum sp. MAR_2009_124 TaxID=1250059 RepID=UPI0008997544|nr:precorrin-6y C5,15-methyltransferase (decarboxylating) subunit CbiE [Tenacibaculum sp. MAR_2009_124]SEB85916.1 precorrin-6Y C5,15-methyltransferase (decarboxylating) [Tenacibaculum sp. MAR_2009_124]
MIFRVLGIGNKRPVFTKEQLEVIKNTTVFSGGKRHLELVKEFLPENYQWIFIKSPMEDLFNQYEKVHSEIIVFASGNPLFYGFSNTLRNKYPKAEIYTEPYFSSIQLLANKTNTNSNKLVAVSVHGRSWKELDIAIMNQKSLIGVLTDNSKNPKSIAERLLDFGYDNYEVSIGEDLEGNQERVQTLSLHEVLQNEYHPLNCLLLHRKEKRTDHFGIKDTEFIGLPGRPKMITKMPIRLTSLHFLDIMNATVFWDIGFCTGSVSIEAKLKNPNLEVIAFEKRLECEEIMLKNQQKYGVPGIEVVMGDFFEQDLEKYKTPDIVFVGGHGGKLFDLLDKLDSVISLGTKIVMNTVQESSLVTFKESCKKVNWELLEEMNIILDSNNPITLLKAIKK